METTKKILTIICGLFLLVSCYKNTPQTEEPIVETDPIEIQLNSAETNMAMADKDFAMDFFSRAYEQNANGAKRKT